MTSIFDNKIERRNTNSFKWDYSRKIFKKDDIIPLWVADMDFQSPIEVIKAIKERAEHGIFGYTIIDDKLNRSFIKWEEKRNNLKIKNDWIIHTTGVVSSINTAIQAFTKEDDKILIQTPVYNPFFTTVTENKRNLIENPLLYNNQKIYIDFDKLEELLKDNVKMMILCSPHNPIGRIWTHDEIKNIVSLCEKYNVILISDEIHSDLVYKDNIHTPSLNVSKNKNNIISLYSPTKTFNIAGLSESITIIPDKEMNKKFIKTMSKNGSDMLNIFGLVAAEAAYEYGDRWLDELLVYLNQNLDYLVEFFKKSITEIKLIKPEATYMVWLDCRELGIDYNELNKFFVLNANIGLNDGKSFGREGIGFQRLNFACRRELLSEALERIREAIQKK